MHSQDFVAENRNLDSIGTQGSSRFKSSIASSRDQFAGSKFYSGIKAPQANGMIKISDLTNYHKKSLLTEQKYNQTTRLPMVYGPVGTTPRITTKNAGLKKSADGVQIKRKVEQIDFKTNLLAPIRSR